MEHLMDFTILNWNVGGAKYLGEQLEERTRFKGKLNDELMRLVDSFRPHVVTLQEIVQYGEKRQHIIEPPPGYDYRPFPLIDSESLSVRAKWRKLEQKGRWPAGTYFAQGNGFLFRKDLPYQPVWSLPREGRRTPEVLRKDYVEKVHLESGLYFGDRDTEPRAALVTHFVFNPEATPRTPLDVFVVNVHLTTLTKEREGVPQIDRRATKMRLAQLDIVFEGIVSRYNLWRRSGFPERGEPREPEAWESFERHEPVWIVAGDFNATMDSVEYRAIQDVNFMDVVPTKGAGTKSPGPGEPATLTLDYVFAGPKFLALNPLLTGPQIEGNGVQDIRVSDHFPMVATIPIMSEAKPREGK